MDVIYKYASDELIETQELLYLQNYDENIPDLDLENHILFFANNALKDIENSISQRTYSEREKQFLFDSMINYNILPESEKEKFQSRLKYFFIKNPSFEIFIQMIDFLDCPEIINEFSQILLSEISIKPKLIEQYKVLPLPNIMLKLMNRYPQIAFPGLIGIFTKTIQFFDLRLLSEIVKLIESSQDPYYYGMAIYRFAELWIIESDYSLIYKLIKPIEHLIISGHYRCPLKTLALLSIKLNPQPSFLYSFKTILLNISRQYLYDDRLEEEDILNSLIFIQLFTLHFSLIPKLCQEINLDSILKLTNHPNQEVCLRSLLILLNLYSLIQSSENPISIQFFIQKVEAVLQNVPFYLHRFILDIYSFLTDIVINSDIEMLLTDSLMNFVFGCFGNEDEGVVSQAVRICILAARKSRKFYDSLQEQLSECVETLNCDEFALNLLKAIPSPD